MPNNPQELEPWQRLCWNAGHRTFAELQAEAQKHSVFFTGVQLEFVRLACLTAASQGMRHLAAAADRESMIAAINTDTAKTPA